jgi:hypothetical protein
MTTVININTGKPFDLYIGRQRPSWMWGGDYHLPRSPWHNLFKEGRDGTRDEVIQKYEHYLLEERPDLIARLPELKDKTLACWCKPEACHGDVLARLAEELA